MTPEDEKEFLSECIVIAERESARFPLPPSTTTLANLDLMGNPVDAILPDVPLGSDSAYSDYYGFPSNPVSIYHTGDTWPRPTGPEAQRVPKEARPVCIHPIAPVWRKLGQRVYEYFDPVGLKWTSIDPVRFAEVGKEAGPLFLWVGVVPGTLSRKNAKDAAVRCKQILRSPASRSRSASRSSPGPPVRGSSTTPPLLTQPRTYAAHSLPRLVSELLPKPTLTSRVLVDSTSAKGLYFCEGGESNRILLLTARHMVLPPSEYRNELYVRKTNSSPRREVILFGSKAYQNILVSIMSKIGHEALMVDHYKTELQSLREAVEGEDAVITGTRETVKFQLAKTEKSIGALNMFRSKITKFWSTENQRILGHVVHAPPISVGTGDKRFTEDWALVELHSEKIDSKGFKGNVINIGTL